MERIVSRLKKIRRNIIDYPQKNKIKKAYQPAQRASFNRINGTQLAVVIHLYYVDSWKVFVERLKNLDGYDFDLYVTMPSSNKHFIEIIRKTHPGATIVIVPNHGRDVLPFIVTAKKLYASGYEYVLKLHSKRSTHRDDGNDWFMGMLDKLLPQDKEIVSAIQAKLSKKNTGIVGPAEVYYPLTVNFPANGLHMTRVIKKIYGMTIAHKYLQVNRAEYGFFGGTMFWARLDAISKLMNFSVSDFELENGQLDATFSHALERLLCIVPEIDGRLNYEITNKAVVSRPYQTDNIPDWSQDHLK
jgi:lipopolysaccharide biosynthesis protein